MPIEKAFSIGIRRFVHPGEDELTIGSPLRCTG
jgi:hypothetical protein